MAETVEKNQSEPMFTELQKRRFAKICERVSQGEISANKSYEYAQIDGDSEHDFGFKGSFKEWIATAAENKWFNHKSPDEPVEAKPTTELPEKKKTNVIVPIIIGVTVAVILYVVVKKMTHNKQ